MKLQDIYDIQRKFDHCKTQDDVRALTIGYASEFGAEYYLAGEMPPENLSGKNAMAYVIGGHWVDRWAERYFSQDYIRRDPTISHVRRNEKPLLWEHIKHDSQDGKRIMSEASSIGLREGITIPQRNLTGNSIGISFSGQKIDVDNPFLVTGLTVISAYAVATHNKVHQQTEIRDKITLTARELEVLKWIADGYTSFEAGSRVGISRATVEKHFRTALTKLGANNRTHAVAVAMRLGLIT